MKNKHIQIRFISGLAVLMTSSWSFAQGYGMTSSTSTSATKTTSSSSSGASGPTSSSYTSTSATKTTSSSSSGASGPSSSSYSSTSATKTTSSSSSGASGPTSSSYSTSSSSSGASGPSSSSSTTSFTRTSSSSSSSSSSGASGPSSSSSTSSTKSSSSSGGYGATSSTSLTSSSSGSSINNTPATTVISIVTGVTNATMAVVHAAEGVANQVVNTTMAIIKPHYDAYQAGLIAEQRELSRILSCMTNCTQTIDDQSLQRANDNGVYRTYVSQGVDPTKQIIPTGPMQRYTMGVRNSLNDIAKQDIAVVDEMFRAGKVQVYAPGEINSINGARILGPIYNELDRQQLFGLQNTIYVQGDVDMTKFGFPPEQAASIPGLTEFNNFGGIAGSLIVMDTVNPPLSFSDTVHHELQHAADSAFFNTAGGLFMNPSTPPELKAAAQSALQSAMLIQDGTFDVAMANSNYVNSFFEVRGYSVNPANKETLARHIAGGTSVDGTHFEKIPIEQARDMAETLIESPALKEIDESFNDFLDVLENSPGVGI